MEIVFSDRFGKYRYVSGVEIIIGGARAENATDQISEALRLPIDLMTWRLILRSGGPDALWNLHEVVGSVFVSSNYLIVL